MVFNSLGLLLIPTLASAAGASSCHGDKFTIPKIPGVQLTNLEAAEVHQYASWPFALGSVPSKERPIDFCNVTITYTHAGWNDQVNVYVWLPLKREDWNGRFLGTGGGGWAAGFEGSVAAAVGLGYAAGMTDTGHDGPPIDASWLLHEAGVVNLPLLYDFAYTSLDDMTKISKQAVESFYGRKADYSYWSGCSTGGRQGMAQAQRFPENYDGILAAAPAINWASFVVAELWPQVIMNELGVYPPTCEFQAITKAAIEACDKLDGVEDGFVSAYGQCSFDPSSLVGKKIDCKVKSHKISQEAVTVAKEAWQGPRNTAGQIEWPGLPYEASFYTEEFGPFGGLVQTECPIDSPTDAGKCTGSPFVMSDSYIRYLLAKDASFDLKSVTREDLFSLLHKSRQEWLSVINTADPDLSAFRSAGGKLLHWHGIADQLIPVNGSSNYYKRVQALDADVRDFYRYFEAPGVAHCSDGSGLFPETALDSLVDWVEKGKAPESIEGIVGSVRRPICPWPLVAAYKGGKVDTPESFECKDDFGAFEFPNVGDTSTSRDEL